MRFVRGENPSGWHNQEQKTHHGLHNLSMSVDTGLSVEWDSLDQPWQRQQQQQLRTNQFYQVLVVAAVLVKSALGNTLPWLLQWLPSRKTVPHTTGPSEVDQDQTGHRTREDPMDLALLLQQACCFVVLTYGQRGAFGWFVFAFGYECHQE